MKEKETVQFQFHPHLEKMLSENQKQFDLTINIPTA